MYSLNMSSPRVFSNIRENVKKGVYEEKKPCDLKDSPRSSESSPRNSDSPRISPKTKVTKKSLRRFTLKAVKEEQSTTNQLVNDFKIFSVNKDSLFVACKKGDDKMIQEIIERCTVADILSAIDYIDNCSEKTEKMNYIKDGLVARLEYFKNK